MSQIYLTKIERKTIFTKSLIFVLVMFIISDLTVTGPVWFNFIPWLYVLGLLGSIKKIDSVLMSIIGAFTVFVSSIIQNRVLNMEVVSNTAVALLLLAFGIITGRMAFEFILEYRLVKYLRKSKKVTYIVLSTIMLLASFILIGLTKGNVISYMTSRTNLNEYISSTYGDRDYTIKTTVYSRSVPGDYIYVVNMDDQEITFVPITVKLFKDANLEERLEILNNELNEKFKEQFKENITNNYDLLKDASIKINYEYTKIDVVPDTIVLYVKVASKDDTKEALYAQLTDLIKEINKNEEIDKVFLTIDDESVQIDEINNITKDYLLLAFDVEELDE